MHCLRFPDITCWPRSNLSLLLLIIPVCQVQVQCEFKTTRPLTTKNILLPIRLVLTRIPGVYSQVCSFFTPPAGRSLCSYLLQPVSHPFPPRSWLSRPPPERAFQTDCQPCWTTPHYRVHTRQHNLVLWEKQPESSRFLISPWFSPLSAKTAPLTTSSLPALDVNV